METAEFFRQYTEAYDRVMSSLSMYRSLIALHREALIGKIRILESGCGPGTLAIELLRQGACVYALDQNQYALDRLSTKAKGNEGRLFTYCQDAHVLPFEDEFIDGVSSMLVLPFMDEPLKYLREHARVLRKGGVFVVSGPDEKSRDDVAGVLREWKDDHAAQGLLDDLAMDWETFEKCTRQSVNAVVQNWFGLEQLSGILEADLGLHVVKRAPNPLYKSGYVIVAEKH
ncbi:class I SAM-dependent methyltransferase [Candidatus Woesearchaeota archaeon]|nr:class I SAM-dependent methyltransferase [Candidatus Woesearchaeota archaeon]